MAKRTLEDFYKESKRIREEVLQQAELLKGNPLRFVITNEITMRVEITKTDLKTIVSKNVGDDKFNAIKNALAKDIPGYLKKATYLGWRPIAEGKHFESAYFAYFSRELGCRTILCMRRMADGDIYKPYAIINNFFYVSFTNGALTLWQHFLFLLQRYELILKVPNFLSSFCILSFVTIVTKRAKICSLPRKKYFPLGGAN